MNLEPMNRLLISIYSNTPLVHKGEPTKSQLRRERNRVKKEKRNEELKQLIRK